MAEGILATRSCFQLLLSPGLQNFASGAPPELPITGRLTAERQQAITELVARCHGFFDHGIPATKARLNKLRSAAEAVGGPDVTPVENSYPSPDAGLKAFAQLQSSAARSQAFVHQLVPVAELLAEPESASPEARFAISVEAVVVSMCQLGQNCSSGSFQNLIGCATTGRCDDGPSWGHDQLVSEAYGPAIQRVAAQLIDKVRQAEKIR